MTAEGAAPEVLKTLNVCREGAVLFAEIAAPPMRPNRLTLKIERPPLRGLSHFGQMTGHALTGNSSEQHGHAESEHGHNRDRDHRADV